MCVCIVQDMCVCVCTSACILHSFCSSFLPVGICNAIAFQSTNCKSVSKLLLKLSTLVVIATILLVSEHSSEIKRFSTILDQLWCCPCCCCCCVHKLQVLIPLKLCEGFEFADAVLGALLFYYLYKHTHHQNEDMDNKGHSLPNAAAATKGFVRTRDSSLSLSLSLSPCLTLTLEY